MFENKFNSKKADPLVEAAKTAMQDGDLRRQAVAAVNEEFGVYNRNAVVRENLAAYDARIEEAYKCMKEGKPLTPAQDRELDVHDDDKIDGKDFAILRARKKKMEEGKKMWEGQEDSSSGLPPSPAAQQAAKQTPTPPTPPKKTSTSDLSSTFSSARGATGMQEAQLDELKKPTAKTAMKALQRASDSDDVMDYDYKRTNRLYNWKQSIFLARVQEIKNLQARLICLMLVILNFIRQDILVT